MILGKLESHLQKNETRWLSLYLADSFFCCAEAIWFDVVPFIYLLSFTHLVFEVKFIKSSLSPRSMSSVPMFSSIYFVVSGLVIRSLIHFELILVCGDRQQSSFILLQVAFQVSQHHLLKRLSFLHCMFLAFFVGNYLSM